MTADELIELLGMEPLMDEGGYFVETYRCRDVIKEEYLPGDYTGQRSFGTAIYYLLTYDSFSAMHRIKSDEIFHFYLGDPVEMLQLHPDGSGEVVVIGPDIKAGQRPQVVVPRNTWQGARLVPGGKFALLGTTVSPGFEYADYEHGNREELVQSYPKYREMIRMLTGNR